MGDVRIEVRNNGPLRVEGSITLVDAQGRPFGLGDRTRISLCRCGQTKNAPLCDGTHKQAGFSSVCEARELPPPEPKP